jgi:anthranilate phosphoribosyltransferase
MNKRGVMKMEHALFIRGFTDDNHSCGMDEVSICSGGTQVAELINGSISNYFIFAGDFGIKPVSPESISPPRGMSKGEFSLKILQGEISGPPLQMILANTALLFRLAGEADDFCGGYQMAEEVFQSGQVMKTVEAVRDALQVLV